jgi:hypothetical protein
MTPTLRELIDSDERLVLTVFPKNGYDKECITVKSEKKAGLVACPVLWMDNVDEVIRDNNYSDEEAYNWLVSTIRGLEKTEKEDFDPYTIREEKMHVRIVPETPSEQFTGYLLPHESGLNLTFSQDTFYNGNDASFIIPKSIMEEYLEKEGVTAEELAKRVIEADKSFQCFVFGSSSDDGMIFGTIREAVEATKDDGIPYLIGFSNKENHYGAVSVLSPMMKEYADILNDDVCVFFDSPHMALAFPKAMAFELGYGKIKEVLLEIRDGLHDEGFLSDDIYLYKKDDGSFKKLDC